MKVAIFLMSLILALPAHASLKTTQEIDVLLVKVMQLLTDKKSDSAAETLLKHWPKDDKAVVTQLKTQLTDANQVNQTNLGKLLSQEKVRTCKVGTFLYRSQAVLKYEEGFVFWNFTFYNSGKSWSLNSYRFNNKDYVPLSDNCLE